MSYGSFLYILFQSRNNIRMLFFYDVNSLFLNWSIFFDNIYEQV